MILVSPAMRFNMRPIGVVSKNLKILIINDLKIKIKLYHSVLHKYFYIIVYLIGACISRRSML